MVRHLIIFFFSLAAVESRAQKLEFLEVERLADVSSQQEDILPLLSSQSKSLYFVRSMHDQNTGGKYSGSDIWVSKFDAASQSWGKASNTIGELNSSGNNAVVGINSSGDMLYLLDTKASKKTSGVYVVKKNGSSWSTPELIPIPGLKVESFVGFYMSPDAEVLLLSYDGPDSKGGEDLYISLKKQGVWSAPRNLGSSINTKGFEISPFLSEDKTKLYFASNGHGGQGDADIFVSERQFGSWEVWSIPVNLGPQINSPKFDAYFSIYRDSVAYLASNRNGQFCDIYQSKILSASTASADESVEKIIAEANSLLSELSESEDRKAIVFMGESLTLSETAKVELSKLVRKVRSSVPVIYTFEVEIHEQVPGESKDEKTALYKRTEEVRNYLLKAGVQAKDIQLKVTESDSRLRSPRYVFVSIKAR